MADLKEQIAAVNALLQSWEPEDISTDEYSHHSGYKPQYLIDALNEVFGLGAWGFEELSSEIASGDNGTPILVISQVRVMLKDVALQPTGWGQARITKGDLGDARKGAQTDALKKALSYFSIGNRAYRGLLPEIPKSNGVAARPQQNGNGNRPAQLVRKPAPAPQAPTPATPRQGEVRSVPPVQPAEVPAAQPEPSQLGTPADPESVEQMRKYICKVFGCTGTSQLEARWTWAKQQALKRKVADPDLVHGDLDALRKFVQTEEKKQLSATSTGGK